MKFYNRKTELAELDIIHKQSSQSGKMTILTGRRRVGKTLLALEFAKNHKFLYLFVSKKTEELLCQEFLKEINTHFSIPVIGEIKYFKDVFKLLLELSTQCNFTLIIDEFQEFYNINSAVFSEIQNLWDSYKAKSKINLIFIGSVYSLMHKIFLHANEPLFNRADRILSINPFTIKDTVQILKDYNNFSLNNLFDYYTITGCMPRYIDLLVSNDCFSLSEILDFILAPNSPFLHEGKNVLIEEFGKDYNTYFSILSLISSGKTSRPEIESILERNIGGYLDRLENDFGIVKKHKPVNAKPGSRLQKYKISDNFLTFWFRFIYSNWSAVETGNFDYIRKNIERDYSTYCGTMLENFFKELIASSGQYNIVGSYWDRKNENEIDIVAINEMEKQLFLAEVKLNKAKINMNKFKAKTITLLNSYKEYTSELAALSLEDAAAYLNL